VVTVADWLFTFGRAVKDRQIAAIKRNVKNILLFNLTVQPSLNT